MTETQTETHDSIDGASDPEADVWSRRSFVRYLAPISVAIPILVEGDTLVGMLRADLGGEQSAWTKPTGVDVGIGGELRPDTPTQEKLRNAALTDAGSGRKLVLSVGVRNTENAPYEFALGAVTTDGGTTVQGGASTDPLPPGGTATFTATYDLPAGATAKAVDTTVTIGNQVAEKTVQLAPVPGSD